MQRKEAVFLPDVCLVCALAEEAKVLMDVFSNQCNVVFKRAFSTRTRREYRYSTIQNIDGEPLNILVSWQPSYGPVETSLHLKPLLEEFKPRFAAMTGICAGDKEKVKLGDIIVAERAFLYEAGKMLRSEDGHLELQRDTLTWPLRTDVLHFTRGFDTWKSVVANLTRPSSKHQQRDWLLNKLLDPASPSIDDINQQELDQHAPNWRKLVRELQEGPTVYLTGKRKLKDRSKIYELRYREEVFPFEDSQQPTVYIVPIASGSAVRSDNPFADIHLPVRGTIAIDMEGASFYRTLAEFPDIHFLLTKGVSDYADNYKDDSYHQYASSVSALYILSLIKEYVTRRRIPEFRQERVQESADKARSSIPPLSNTMQLTRQDFTAARQDALNLFYSYASEDEPLRRELEKHLVMLRRQGWIRQWYAHDMSAGQDLEIEIATHLQQAQIILLLISPDFLASDPRYEKELLPALTMHEEGKAHIIPILLRATEGWQETPLGRLVVIPRNHRPVTQWPNRDAAFAEVAWEIKKVVELTRDVTSKGQ